MTAYQRRSFSGVAVATTLAAGLNNSATSFTVVSAAGWPSGSSGPYFAVIDLGTTNEEKVLVSVVSGTTVTCLRGQDGTTAVAHNAGVPVYVCLAATDLDEANQAVVATLGTVTAKGDLLVASGANALGRLPIGTTGQIPVVSGGTLVYESISALIDSTATDIQPVTNTRAAGSVGAPADAGHQHALGIGTTKGDILAYSGSAWAPIPVGLNGQVLVSDSTQTDGVGWETPNLGQLFTASGTFTTPNDGVTHTWRIVASGGGGGGGGGSGQGNTGNGGGGGGAAQHLESYMTIAPNTALTVTIGAGGAGGAGGPNGSAGTDGTNGSNTTLTGTGVSVLSRGGNHGGGGTSSGISGQGGQAAGCSALSGAMPGSGGSANTPNGGGAGSNGTPLPGGTASGGGGGNANGSGSAGAGGGAGTPGSGGTGGGYGAVSGNSGTAGTAAAAKSGCGGGGGGAAGASGASGAGGNGGAGGSGWLLIESVS